MSRSNYSEDGDDGDYPLALWRGAVISATRGKRGQTLLKEMLAAFDAMPVKRLIADALIDENGEPCAMGCVGRARGIDMSKIDPENPDQVAKAFGIAPALAREIAYENDDDYRITPEVRFERVRKWVASQIIAHE